MTPRKPKFKDRYVLGVGYPWVIGTGKIDSPYTDVRLWPKQTNSHPPIKLKVPIEIWDENVPKYRLVLEKVK